MVQNSGNGPHNASRSVNPDSSGDAGRFGGDPPLNSGPHTHDLNEPLSGLTDEQREQGKAKFRGYVDSTLEQLAKYVSSIKEWTPDEKQDRAVAGFEGLMGAALRLGTSDEDRQLREDISEAVSAGTKVFPSADPELGQELSERFTIAMGNVLKFIRQEAITKNPAIEEIAAYTTKGERVERSEDIDQYQKTLDRLEQEGNLEIRSIRREGEIDPAAADEYKGEFNTSLWLVKIGLTKAVQCPDLMKQFVDQVKTLPPELRSAFANVAPPTYSDKDGPPDPARTPEEFGGQVENLFLTYAAWASWQAQKIEKAFDRMNLQSQLKNLMGALGIDRGYEYKLDWLNQNQNRAE